LDRLCLLATGNDRNPDGRFREEPCKVGVAGEQLDHPKDEILRGAGRDRRGGQRHRRCLRRLRRLRGEEEPKGEAPNVEACP